MKFINKSILTALALVLAGCGGSETSVSSAPKAKRLNVQFVAPKGAQCEVKGAGLVVLRRSNSKSAFFGAMGGQIRHVEGDVDNSTLECVLADGRITRSTGHRALLAKRGLSGLSISVQVPKSGNGTIGLAPGTATIYGKQYTVDFGFRTTFQVVN